MRTEPQIPVGAETAVQSVRWAIQSRADASDPWRTENDDTPALPGDFEKAARRLLSLYRAMHPERESRLVRRTIVCLDEPVDDRQASLDEA